MRHGFDTSDPAAVSFAGFDVAGGYIGGRTPHVWTAAQWDAQPARWRAPFWLFDPARNIAEQATGAVHAMMALQAPPGSLIFLDMETLTAPAAVDLFANEVHARGYTCGVYGSTSTLFANPPRAGYLVADPTGTAHLYGHADVIGTQYGQAVLHGITVDLDVYTDTCPLWDARPAGPPARPKWALDTMESLSIALADITDAIDLVRANT